MEEIFQRSERQFVSEGAKLAWLSSFERPERGSNAYTKAAVQVRDELISFDRIKQDIQNAKNFREINNLSDNADRLYFDDLRSEAKGLVNNRIRILEGEAEEEKKRFKEAEKLKEREKAEERLRELAPKALGGIKSGETRRGKVVLRDFDRGLNE